MSILWKSSNGGSYVQSFASISSVSPIFSVIGIEEGLNTIISSPFSLSYTTQQYP